MAHGPSLVIEKVNKTYANGVAAMQNISLTLGPGLFGLLGPNGAGKSTLMRTLATLQGVDSGSVRLGDVDVLTQRTGFGRCWDICPRSLASTPR